MNKIVGATRMHSNGIQMRHVCCLKQELFQELNFSKLIFLDKSIWVNSNKLTLFLWKLQEQSQIDAAIFKE